MKIIGVIPARYRSSRFPGKPLADICGRPMIWWVYRQAKKVEQLDAVYVATDDERIQAACEGYGIPVVMTSPDHPTGSDRVAEVATKVEGDLFINIQGDEPLMEPEMVRQVIRLFDDPEVYFGSLKKKITDPDLIAADSTVKVVTDDLNNAMYFSRNPIPSGLKDVDKVDVYKHVGIYAYKRDFLLKFGAMPQSSLELAECVEPLRAMQAGYKMRFAETEYENISVDYPRHLDVVIAEIRRLGLDKTIEEFKRHDKARFTQDNFIESIDFDYLEIQVLEE